MVSDRQRRILDALIGEYVYTAEPVGSNTLVRRYNLGVSPATVRNELASLEDGGYVNSSCKGYDYLKMDGDPALFRAEALGNRRFIITTQASDYTKVLCNSKGAKLSAASFEPNDPLQVWIIN